MPIAQCLMTDRTAAGGDHLYAEDSARPFAERWGPKQIGQYRVERELGRGGMGVVYLAWRADQQFQKQVAIKLLQGSMTSEEALKRFRFERQILANLEHPNIARLLDGGATERGEPYIVMEYVRGGAPIDRYCEEHGLRLDQRLKLFQTVCSAVEYAHQHLIVHRDLKPGNILVTGDGQVKLLDFGIAKALVPVFGPDEAAHTKTGVLAMTPEYASPEQLRGEPIGVASDVYTLGVVLYQLLTGCLPFRTRAGGIPELMREVCEQEPRKPSTAVANRTRVTGHGESFKESALSQIEGRVKLSRKLSGDVDNIVLMTMRKEAGRRYASVEQLREDIRRYLEGLPVVARPATAMYRAEKFGRRHAGAIAAATLLAASLVGGMVATSRQAQRADEQRVLAQHQAAEADRQRQLAMKNSSVAKAQADEAQRQRRNADDRFEDVRKLAASLIFDVDVEVARLSGSTAARKVIVEKGLEYLELLSRERADDKQLGEELAKSYAAIGRIQRARNIPNLGDAGGSRKSYEKVLEIAGRVEAKHGNSPSLVKARADAYNGLGDLCYLDGDLPAARGHFAKGLQLAEHYARISPPQDYEAIRYPLRLYGKLADIHMENGQMEQAEILLLRARDWCDRAWKTRQESITASRDRVVSNTHLGILYRKSDRWQEALKLYEHSAVIIEALLTRPEAVGRVRRDYMVNEASLGDCWRNLGSYEKALEHHSRELDFCKRQYQEDPKNVLSHYDLTSSQAHVALDLSKLGRHEQALEHAIAAIKASESAAAIEPRSVMTQQHLNTGLETMVNVLMGQRNWQEAAKYSARMVAMMEEAHRKQPNEGMARELAKQYVRAGDFYRSAAFLADRERHLQEAHRYYTLAVGVYRKLEDTEEQKYIARKLNGVSVSESENSGQPARLQ
jgi:serine/threonine protein kinase/tetratricopeptide (TPR) repeat protein